jgi:hypothetical protein
VSYLKLFMFNGPQFKPMGPISTGISKRILSYTVQEEEDPLLNACRSSI